MSAPAPSSSSSSSSSSSDPPTAAFAAISRAPARLYRHALESILAFLDRGELAAALRVSKEWLGAVQSMRSLQLFVLRQPTAPLDVVAASVMGRHVAALDNDLYSDRIILSADALHTLALRMAHLRRLVCELTLPLPLSAAGAALAFPAALRELHIQLTDAAGAAAINAALETVSRLSLLEELAFYPSFFDAQISLAPLAALPRLQVLGVYWHAAHVEISDAQVDQLRALPHLRSVGVGLMTTALLSRLLRPPHDLQWQQATLPHPLDDEAAALLPQLPSLTKLDSLPTTCARYDWLRGLPRLAHVSLAQEDPAAAGTAESLVAGLQCCTHITHLHLEKFEELTVAQLTDLLPRLPRLRELELDDLSVRSLSFLAQEPMTSQLTKLALISCYWLPLAHRRHVHKLRGLTHLTLDSGFRSPMDKETQAHYQPPSRLMPQLQSFYYDFYDVGLYSSYF